jgi:hypothetical protein
MSSNDQYATIPPIFSPSQVMVSCGCRPLRPEEENALSIMFHSRMREIQQVADSNCRRELDRNHCIRKSLPPGTQDETGVLYVDAAGDVSRAALRLALPYAENYPTKIKLSAALGNEIFRVTLAHRDALGAEFGTDFPQYPGPIFQDVMRTAVRQARDAAEEAEERRISQAPGSATLQWTIAEKAKDREYRLQSYLTFESERRGRKVTIAAVRRGAEVYDPDMLRWRHGKLPDDSEISVRIEEVLACKREPILEPKDSAKKY